MGNINLQRLREQAKLSQQEVGERLNLSQAQISRYEADPDNVPIGLLTNWLKTLGTSLADVATKEEPDTSGRLEINAPYAALERNLKLLKEYLEAADPELQKEALAGAPTLSSLRNKLLELRRKPNLVLMGAFDAGKSHLANSLMGVNHLPSEYQPATRIKTYIRHADDRPSWFPEDVWIFKEGFNSGLWEDEAHCKAHKIIAGSFETLKHYAAHGGRKDSRAELAHSALVFIDAALLKACTIVDLPGFDAQEDDTRLAMNGAQEVDILLYLSPINGFMKGEDFNRLTHLLRLLPVYEQHHPGMPTLGNLFIIATHASPSITDEKLQNTLERATHRIHDQLSEYTLKLRGEQSGRKMTPAAIRNRVFTYWSELPRRREQLEATLLETLSVHMPRVWAVRLERELTLFKEQSKGYYVKQIKGYERLVEDLQRVQRDYEELKAKEPSFRADVQKKRTNFSKKLQQCRTQSLEVLNQQYKWASDADEITKLIRQKYSRKEDAQQYAMNMVLEVIQGELTRKCLQLTRELRKELEDVVKLYDGVALTLSDQKANQKPVDIPFDASVPLIGAIAGSVIATIAGVVGSIPLILGIAALLTAIFGESWQQRLAKRLIKALAENQIREKFEAQLNAYWDGIDKDANAAVKQMEARYSDYMERLSKLINKPGGSKAELHAMLKRLEQARDFFAGMPWRPLQE